MSALVLVQWVSSVTSNDPFHLLIIDAVLSHEALYDIYDPIFFFRYDNMIGSRTLNKKYIKRYS